MLCLYLKWEISFFLRKYSEHNLSALNLLYVCSPTADTLQTGCSRDAEQSKGMKVNFRVKTSVNLHLEGSKEAPGRPKITAKIWSKIIHFHGP